MQDKSLVYMERQIKTIGILTSGGDAPGMNAAIRAVTRTARFYDINVIGVMRGYQGLIDKEFVKFTSSSVSNTIQRGGTPSAYDRILASRLGYAAIEALQEGQRNIMIGIKNDEIVYVPISRAIKTDKPINQELISVLNVLSM